MSKLQSANSQDCKPVNSVVPLALVDITKTYAVLCKSDSIISRACIVWGKRVPLCC